MSKITIAGNSFVVTSSISLADIEKIKKYRPSALTITDPETKEVQFKIGIGTNNINDFSISFGGVSNDEGKLAIATLPIPCDVEDAKAYVLDRAGLAIANLNKLEDELIKVLKDIRAEHELIAETITISV